MSLVSVRLKVERSPFRLAPAWALLAGVALASTWPRAAAADGWTFTTANVVLLALALLLVDPIWGGLWTQMLFFPQALAAPNPSSATPSLPYAQAQAPLTQLWQWLHDDDSERRGRNAGLSLLAMFLALAGVLALMKLIAPYPPVAGIVLATSLAVIALAVLGAAVQPAYPAGARLLGALVAVALPWLLGLELMGQATFYSTPAQPMWLLIAGFTFLAFAQEQMAANASSRQSGVLVALWPAATLASYAILVIGLVLVQEPWAAALAALAFCVPAVRMVRRGRGPAWVGAEPWHLLGLVLVVIALSLR